LDEFDESNEEIRTALLPLLDKGKYNEPTRGRELSPGLNTIWIMAMRGSLETLSRFFQEFEKLGDDFLETAPLEDLQFKLSSDVIGQVGAQIAGCIQGVIPFFPFSKYEAAAVAHSFLLKRIRECREPFSRKDKKITGDLHIHLLDDEGICKLAAESYMKEVGASSLDTAVTRLFMEPIAKLAMIGSTGLAADPKPQGL
jgi:ATP-dependent Clp protease ATP-binding subunit ClpA